MSPKTEFVAVDTASIVVVAVAIRVPFFFTGRLVVVFAVVVDVDDDVVIPLVGLFVCSAAAAVTAAVAPWIVLRRRLEHTRRPPTK